MKSAMKSKAKHLSRCYILIALCHRNEAEDYSPTMRDANVNLTNEIKYEPHDNDVYLRLTLRR